jgi:ferredoxin
MKVRMPFDRSKRAELTIVAIAIGGAGDRRVAIRWRGRTAILPVCKYVCPVSVPLKLGTRFSLLKVQGDPEKCCERQVCEKVCPMDIQITEYIKRGERVLSTECILCQACIDVCPEQALALSFGLDRGGKEFLGGRGQPVSL